MCGTLLFRLSVKSGQVSPGNTLRFPAGLSPVSRL